MGLLSQLLREWTFAAAPPFEVLCVCSDQTVGTKGNDEAIHSVADLAFPVTSNVDEVKNFLSGAGNRVVFSTYQSSSVIAAAQANPATPAFDLAVADEAHRCAGKVGSDFPAILDNVQIRSKKRLFVTATPRTYSSTVKTGAIINALTTERSLSTMRLHRSPIGHSASAMPAEPGAFATRNIESAQWGIPWMPQSNVSHSKPSAISAAAPRKHSGISPFRRTSKRGWHSPAGRVMNPPPPILSKPFAVISTAGF